MTYHFSKTLIGNFDEIKEKVVEALKEEGFGVITEIDVQATFKKKLDVDFRPYHILGACNPAYAYEALQSESHIGAMLPCNVVLQEINKGQVEVSAVDPVSSMQAVKNEGLAETATKVQGKLRNVIEKL